MPKSKRNKTVDLSKTKKHGLEGKKELYSKIQTNVENYAHVFVFAVNDMRNTKMKNVREQWKHSRFCIGKNKVMAMALGRTPEEEYRPNLHKIGQMLVGERGLLFTNQSLDEVTNWFQSYSEGDFARSGNVATEDVILPEGPLEQFPHNLESYLRQLGLPTTLKKGVIHLVKEHVVCTEGDRLSPETARILKLLGYEMAEFRIKMLSVWSQDGSFVNLQSESCDPETKENAASSPKKSFMREDFELAKDCALLGDDDDEMEVAGDDSEDEVSNHSEKVIEDLQEESVNIQKSVGKNSFIEAEESLETVASDLKEKEDSEQGKSNSKKNKRKSVKETEENSEDDESCPELVEQEPSKNTKSSNKEKQTDETENGDKNSSPVTNVETEDLEMEVEEIQEPESKKPKNDSPVKKTGRKTVNRRTAKKTEKQASEEASSKEEIVDNEVILKLTEKKLQESVEKPKKFSPKMTRARAAAANKKVKTPEPLETKRASRKRKV